MNDVEKMIWAAAYAIACNDSSNDNDSLSIADSAVVSFRYENLSGTFLEKKPRKKKKAVNHGKR